jgi:hypothetical protein
LNSIDTASPTFDKLPDRGPHRGAKILVDVLAPGGGVNADIDFKGHAVHYGF